MLRLSCLIFALLSLAACSGAPGVGRLDATPLSGPAFAEAAPEVQMTEQARALDAAMAELVRHSTEIETLSAVDPALGQAQARMAWMNDRLADLVSVQNREIALLEESRAEGHIRKQAYARQMARITRAQDAVSQALADSVAQAQAALAGLKTADRKAGGLDWQILSVETLADEARQIASRAGLI